MSNSQSLVHVDLEMSPRDLEARYAALGLDYSPIVVMVAGMDPAAMAILVHEHMVYQSLLEHPVSSPVIIVGGAEDQPHIQHSMEQLVQREGQRLCEAMVRSMKQELLPTKPENERGWYRRFEKRKLR
jgi:hypothetical protein